MHPVDAERNLGRPGLGCRAAVGTPDQLRTRMADLENDSLPNRQPIDVV